jgi:hypothetical protein
MVTSSTNINIITNNHFWFQIIERKRHMALDIQVQYWDRHKHVAGLNWLMWSQPPPLGIQIATLDVYSTIRPQLKMAY